MHNNSTAQDLGLGLLICVAIVIAFIGAVIFFSVVMLTVVCVLSAGLWATHELWRIGKGVPPFRDEVILLGGVTVLCGLAIAIQTGTWCFSVTWGHRPTLMTVHTYLEFVAFNGSLAALIASAKARGINEAFVASVASHVLRLAIRGTLAFTLLSILVTHVSISNGLMFLTSMLPLAIASAAVPSFPKIAIQALNLKKIA
jgi:hypothetical protein